MSLLAYAGASQLAAFQLLDGGAALPVIVAAALVVNLRLLMYSASIAPHFQRMASWRRWPLAYLLVDQVYAVSLIEFTDNDATNRTWYYLGVAVPNWVAWQSGVVLGVLFGTDAPQNLHLEFAIPLLFVAILVPTVKDRPTLAAGVVGGAVAIAGLGLPLQLGLVTGAVAGLMAGILVDMGGT